MVRAFGTDQPGEKQSISLLETGRTSRCQWMIDELQRLLRIAALTIIPAYRTTPTAALLREADLPFAEPLLDSIRQRACVRHLGLDPGHPLATITPAQDTAPK